MAGRRSIGTAAFSMAFFDAIIGSPDARSYGRPPLDAVIVTRLVGRFRRNAHRGIFAHFTFRRAPTDDDSSDRQLGKLSHAV